MSELHLQLGLEMPDRSDVLDNIVIPVQNQHYKSQL